MKKINGTNQDAMIQNHTTLKMQELVRTIEDQKAVIKELKKELAGYKQPAGPVKGQGDMPNCTSCGSPIPEGQDGSCSMCYGDIDHGSDGYYRDWAERQQQSDIDHQWVDEQY